MKSPEHKVDSLGLYLLIYVALMVLLIATVWVAEFDLGTANTAISLSIAIAKAVLVILFFMHVRHGGGLIWVFAAASFLWLSLLLGLTLTDYTTRRPEVAPPPIPHPIQTASAAK